MPQLIKRMKDNNRKVNGKQVQPNHVPNNFAFEKSGNVEVLPQSDKFSQSSYDKFSQSSSEDKESANESVLEISANNPTATTDFLYKLML